MKKFEHKPLNLVFIIYLFIVLPFLCSCDQTKYNDNNQNPKFYSSNGHDWGDDEISGDWMYMEITCAQSTVGFEEICWSKIINPEPPPLLFTESEISSILQDEAWNEITETFEDNNFANFCSFINNLGEGWNVIFQDYGVGTNC